MIIEQIREDRARALEADDPTGQVCYLATVEADGSPSVRTLVLREVLERSVRLFINASSPKWRALSANSACQILLWYPSIQIQYRLSGAAAIASRADIENNWHRRPLRAKLLDYFYATRAAQRSGMWCVRVAGNAISMQRREPRGRTASRIGALSTATVLRGAMVKRVVGAAIAAGAAPVTSALCQGWRR